MTPKMGEGKVFVVIDALRATTTIVEALSNGCTEVIPVVTIDEALDRAKRSPRGKTLMIDLLGKKGVDLTDAARAVRILYKAFERYLLKMVRTAEHRRTLIRSGFEEDLGFCLRADVSPLVPVFRNGAITLG